MTLGKLNPSGDGETAGIAIRCWPPESVWWNHSYAGPSSPSRIEIRMDLTVPELPASFPQATHTAQKALPLKGSLQRLVAVRSQTSCGLEPSNLVTAQIPSPDE